MRCSSALLAAAEDAAGARRLDEGAREGRLIALIEVHLVGAREGGQRWDIPGVEDVGGGRGGEGVPVEVARVELVDARGEPAGDRHVDDDDVAAAGADAADERLEVPVEDGEPGLGRRGRRQAGDAAIGAGE
jgi:hypothetical protein